MPRKIWMSPQNDQVVIIISQRDCSHACFFRCKFHIRLIHHYKNSVLEAGVQDQAHLVSVDGGGGRIVGIAQHQKVDGIIQVTAEVVRVQAETVAL